MTGESNCCALLEIQQHKGPLPSPLVFEQYDQVVPGAAERIIDMAEGEAEHKRSMERVAIEATSAEVKRGQFLGFIAAIFGLTTALVLGYQGHGVAASIVGSGYR